ncbi:MAG: response regulator [Candidatus Lokiarchaeota archaeon]|nr:response regulator [Candidatus Harpocratesius repetitus]
MFNSKIYQNLCGFLWIRPSGVPYFKWFSPENTQETWKINDLFFSGFFSAISSSSEVFFGGDPLRYLEFSQYKIYTEKTKNNDLFVVIAKKETPEQIAKTLLEKMLEHYFDSNLTSIHEIEEDYGSVQEKFMQILSEIEKNWNKIKNNNIDKKRQVIIPFSSENQIKSEKTSNLTIGKNGIHRQAKKIAELEQKLGAVSILGRTIGHTLNNILATILGNVNLSKLEVSEKSEIYKNLDETEYACIRARNLIFQLLNISKNISSATSSKEIELIARKKMEEIDNNKSYNLPDNIQDKAKSLVLGKGSILLMDDDKAILETGRKMINRLGYKVNTSKNLKNALETYIQHQKQGTPFDVVILDFSAIGGVGEFGSLIWKYVDPKVKAIVSSGYSGDPIFNNYRKFGYSGVLKKPYNLGELSLILSQIINHT